MTKRIADVVLISRTPLGCTTILSETLFAASYDKKKKTIKMDSQLKGNLVKKGENNRLQRQGKSIYKI